MKKPRNARIIYQGPSVLNPNEEIIAVLTFGSGNKKTGNLWTLFFFPAKLLGVEVRNGALLRYLSSGGDQSVCEGCIHSSKGFGDCYTWPLLNKGPARMIESLQNRINAGENVYLDFYELMIMLNNFKPMVRLGGYGDPVCLPKSHLNYFLGAEIDILGYTHMWHKINPNDRAYYQSFLMASVDSQMQKEFAQAKGWRTFRVGQKKDEIDKNTEFHCPASKEMQKKLMKLITCKDCKKCNGNRSKAKSTFIPSHGSYKNRFKELRVFT